MKNLAHLSEIYMTDKRPSEHNYTKYYDYILQEKQKQYDALLLINGYMGDLMKTEKLVDSQLRTAKHDQKDILREIEKVKAELDELIS